MIAIVPEPPVAVIAITVFPPAHDESRHTAPIAASDEDPNAESWTKLSVTPPSVQEIAVGLFEEPDAAATTISVLSAPVLESKVIDSEDVAELPCLT
jgi:hypothetical protein